MGEKKRVLSRDGLTPECVVFLEAQGFDVDAGPAGGEDELVAAIPGYDALVVGPGVAVTPAVLRAGSRLRVVGRADAGPGAVALDEATRQGVIVVHAPDADVVSDAELALALLLSCARVLPRTDAALRAGIWDARGWVAAGTEVRGKTLGLVGLRDSSALLAEAARALGMSVVVSSPEATAAAGEAPTLVEAADVYEAADLIVLALPADAAPDLLGAAEFGLMKPGVRLVATTGLRGIDLDALRDALRTGRVQAAAAVVAADEAATAAGVDGLLLAPRLEAATADARLRAGMSVAGQVAAVLQGRFPEHALNVPLAAGDDAAELMPYLGLCAQLGRLLVQLAGGPVPAVDIVYGGSFTYFDTRLLTLGVLGGVLSDRHRGPVNFVNAERVAAELGVTASETQQTAIPDFPRLITVSAAGAGGEVSVSGTSLGPEHKPRFVRLFGEDIDIAPAPHMAFLRYVDAAGVGGALGTMLGEWGVNIGHMSVGRGTLGDEAVMALTLDEPLSPEQVDQLVARCHLAWARAVEL